MVSSNHALSATHKAPTIIKIPHEKGIKASVRCYQSGTIHRLPGSGRISKITEEIKAIVEGQIRANETTAVQLRKLLSHLSTVLCCRVSLG